MKFPFKVDLRKFPLFGINSFVVLNMFNWSSTQQIANRDKHCLQEEVFTEFWIVEPQHNAVPMIVAAFCVLPPTTMTTGWRSAGCC